jgi:hypothetical protein
MNILRIFKHYERSPGLAKNLLGCANQDENYENKLLGDLYGFKNLPLLTIYRFVSAVQQEKAGDSLASVYDTPADTIKYFKLPHPIKNVDTSIGLQLDIQF